MLSVNIQLNSYMHMDISKYVDYVHLLIVQR